MNDRLCVRVRVEPVSPALQLLPQIREVINFPVEDDPNRLVLVVDRLVAASDVDDAQAAHSQAHAAFGIDPLVVRTAMDERLAHLMDQWRSDSAPFFPSYYACDSTHL